MSEKRGTPGCPFCGARSTFPGSMFAESYTCGTRRSIGDEDYHTGDKCDKACFRKCCIEKGEQLKEAEAEITRLREELEESKEYIKRVKSAIEFASRADKRIRDGLRSDNDKLRSENERLRQELESTTQERKDILDTAKACLVAAGGSEDEDELLRQLNNAGRKPSDFVRAQLDKLREKNERLREAFSKANDEICQELGKALGYPWYKDDQKTFPDATEENGVCTGDHVAESIAMEAARTIEELRKDAERYKYIRCGRRTTAIYEYFHGERFLKLEHQLDSAIDAAKEAE